MAIKIENREAERLLEELARRTGKGQSELLLELLKRELQHHKRTALRAIAVRASGKIARDPRSADEIIGYGEDGLPK